MFKILIFTIIICTAVQSQQPNNVTGQSDVVLRHTIKLDTATVSTVTVINLPARCALINVTAIIDTGMGNIDTVICRIYSADSFVQLFQFAYFTRNAKATYDPFPWDTDTTTARRIALYWHATAPTRKGQVTCVASYREMWE